MCETQDIQDIQDVQDIKVLVVDDDDSIRQVLSVALSVADGISEVRQASDGPQAVQLCESYKPDVIFLDYWMPAMDGEKAADSIRQLCPGAHIVSFSGVIESKPPWADQHYVKGEMPDVEAVIAASR